MIQASNTTAEKGPARGRDARPPVASPRGNSTKPRGWRKNVFDGQAIGNRVLVRRIRGRPEVQSRSRPPLSGLFGGRHNLPSSLLSSFYHTVAYEARKKIKKFVAYPLEGGGGTARFRLNLLISDAYKKLTGPEGALGRAVEFPGPDFRPGSQSLLGDLLNRSGFLPTLLLFIKDCLTKVRRPYSVI